MRDEGGTSLTSALTNSTAVVAIATSEGRVLFSNRPGAALSDVFTSPGADELAGILTHVASSRATETLDAAIGAATYQLTLSPVVEGDRVTSVLGVAVDVTSRKAAEDRLRRKEALLVDAQGVAHLGLWEWDVSQPHLTWSDELYRIYALTPEVYTPSYEGYLAMIHPDDRERVRKATESVFRDHLPFSHDERILRPDGSIRYLHTWAQAEVDADGKLLKLVGVCQDITERKMAEHALVEAGKHEAIGRLAAGIAHDFNNVLAVALANVGIVQGSLPPDHAWQKNLEEISTAAAQGARLTRQLLTVGRSSNAEPETMDLGKVARGLAEFLRRAAGAVVELEVRVTGDRPPLVTVNRSEVEQIILNLVVNARDAMPKGGRLVIEVGGATGATKTPTDVDLAVDPVVLSVSDTGVGMEDAVRARVFDPYFSTKPQGHGLGLATVFGIVRKAGGAITVDSEIGKGTTFRVFLPRTDERLESIQMPAARPAPHFSGTILLVDDQDVLRRSLNRVLVDMGFTVLEARNPAEALAFVDVKTQRIDVLLTDVVMPGMNGIELARRVLAARPDVKVVLMTGSSDEGILSQRDGQVPLLNKPFTMAALADELRRVLGN